MSRKEKAAPEPKTFRVEHGIEVNTLAEDKAELLEFEQHIAGLDKDDTSLIVQMQEQMEVKRQESVRELVRAVCPRCNAYKLEVNRKRETWTCGGCDWRGNLNENNEARGLVGMNEVGPELERWRLQGAPKGASTGWANIDKLYVPRRGELSLVTGIPGSGKSTWLTAMHVNMALHERWKFGVFSPENPSPVLLLQMVLKVVGKRFEEMSVSELRLATDWVNQHFTIIDPVEATPENIMRQASKLVKQKGIQGLVIDPWTEVDYLAPPNLRDDQYLKLILGKIKAWQRRAHVHTWIVVHPKNMTKETDSKSKKRYPVPTPYDLNGGSQWFNKADWCLCIHRPVLAKQNDLDADTGTVQVHVQKGRFTLMGGALGAENLQYHENTASYFESTGNPPEPWPIQVIMERLKKTGHKFEEGWTWPPKDGLGLRPIIWVKDGPGYLHMGDKHEATVQPADGMFLAKIWLIARKGDPYSEREQYADTLDGAFEAAERQLMDWDFLPARVK